jgi:hypothetical protein
MTAPDRHLLGDELRIARSAQTPNCSMAARKVSPAAITFSSCWRHWPASLPIVVVCPSR